MSTASSFDVLSVLLPKWLPYYPSPRWFHCSDFYCDHPIFLLILNNFTIYECISPFFELNINFYFITSPVSSLFHSTLWGLGGIHWRCYYLSFSFSTEEYSILRLFDIYFPFYYWWTFLFSCNLLLMFLLIYSGSEVPGSYIICTFTFLMECQSIFESVLVSLYITPPMYRSSCCSTYMPTCECQVFNFLP